MKRKLFIVLLAICCVFCFVSFGACKKQPTPDVTGLQDYSDSDTKIITSLSYDVAEKTEAFYIGSSAIQSVEVNGTALSENDYIVRNNYLLMADDWYGQIGVGSHVIKVTYKTKSLEFKFVISDNKALVFEMPNVNNSYVIIDDATLPLVEFPVVAQEKEVTYSIKDEKGKAVNFSIENEKIKLTNPKEGTYTYSVVATRNGKTAINETCSFKVVSREYYEGIIDPTNGSDNLDMWYVLDQQNSFGYADFTDVNGTTRSALYYNRVSKLDNHTRAIGFNRAKLVELLRLGYTKIGFWYCLDIPQLATNIHINFYRDGNTWGAREFAIANVWTYKELDLASFVTVDMLLNDDSSNFVVGFITQNYNEIFQNEPLTAYFSEVVALDRVGDASEYLGTYTCDESSIVLAENGVATVDGKTCSFWVNNNHLVIDDGNHNYSTFVIGNGLIVSDGNQKIYKSADNTLKVDANVKTDIAELFKCFTDNGIACSVFVSDNGVDDGVADTEFTFVLGGNYTAKVDFSELSVTYTINPELPTTTGNLATTLYSSGKVSCYLANNEQTGQLFHYGTENKLYFNCFAPSLANAMIFDNDFVKECFVNGLTCIKVTYYCSHVGSDAWVRIAPALYNSTADTFTQFGCNTSGKALKKGETVTIIWQLTAEDVQSIDFDSGFKLAISGLGASAYEKTQIVFESFEFCAPEA